MTDLLATLNKEQAEAVTQIAGPLLILAGAGSGKTKALTTRIAYLLEQGVKPYNILAITFTNKAAKEMRSRVDKLVGEAAQNVWLYTFHGFCNQILRREIKHIPPYTSSFSIYDTTDCRNLVKDVLKKLNMDEKYYPVAGILGEISKAKNNMQSPARFMALTEDFHGKKVAEVYQEYENKLKQSNALDFDDLLLLTVKLLQDNPDVAAKYQERFAYVLVDEYQDTNHVQYLLTKMLCAKHHNLCVVGDIDQSIYGWRGADISNILDFESDYPETKIIKLEQNYRSTQVILDAANAVIANNVERKPKNLWTDNGNGLPITYFEAADDREEAAYVVEQIRGMLNEGISLGDIAVLYRTNAQSRIFEENLIKNGFSYVMVGSLKFYDRKEVKDILAYLRLLYNHRDMQALDRIINVPKRGIGAASVLKLTDLLAQTGNSIFGQAQLEDGFKALGKVGTKIADFVKLLEKLQAKVDKVPLPVLLETVIEETNYASEFEDEDEEKARSRGQNLDELVRIAQEFTADEDEENTLDAFLNHVALVADIDDAKLSSEAVTLMTMHSSKGLEFPVIFLAGMEEGLFPSARAGEGDEAIEEERRLCYVGITRAKRRLFLSSCRSRMMYGRIVMYQPSRFLAEIPRNLITKVKSYSNPGYGYTRPQSGLRSIAHDRQKEWTFGKPAPAKHENFTPAADTPLETFSLGDKVKHKKWGIGTIVHVSPEEEGQQVKVAFTGQGVKTILTRLRVIEKI